MAEETKVSLNQEVLALVISFINLAIVLAPELIKDGRRILNLLTSPTEITEDELKAIRQELKDSLDKLLSKVDERMKEAGDMTA